jgi:hypothetical protein
VRVKAPDRYRSGSIPVTFSVTTTGQGGAVQLLPVGPPSSPPATVLQDLLDGLVINVPN